MYNNNVINEIIRFLSSADQRNKPELQELAEKYVVICSELNTRLNKCASFLSKGLRSEAVHYAETAPTVLETANLLQFNGWREWIEFCREYELPRPPFLQEQVIQELQKAYQHDSALKPLMDRYRKTIHKGSLAEKISLLRKIALLDWTNSNWKEDLVNFEKEQIVEYTQVAKKAIEGKDCVTLMNTYDILVGEKWSINVDSKVLNKIERQLKIFRVKSLKERALLVLDEVADAYSLLDPLALDHAMEKWKSLVLNDEFEPTENELVQVKEASEWLDSQMSEKANKHAFGQLLGRLKYELEHESDFSRITNTYYKLRNYDYEVPDLIEKRYRQAVENDRVKNGRKFRQKMTIIVAMLLVVIFGSVWILERQNYEKELKRWSSEIHKSIADKKYDEANKLLKELSKKDKKIYKVPAIQGFRNQLDSLIQKRYIRRIELQEIIEKLKVIQDASFLPRQEADGLLLCANKLADSEEQKTLLRGFARAKKELIHKEIRIATAVLQKQLEKLDLFYKQFADIDPFEKNEIFNSKTAIFSSMILAVEKARKESALGFEDLIQIHNARLDGLNTQLENSAKMKLRKDEILLVLKENPFPLENYYALLQEFSDTFPLDKRAAVFKSIGILAPINNEFIWASGYSVVTLKEKQVDDLLTSAMALNNHNMTKELVTTVCRARKPLIANLKEVKDNLRGLTNREFMNFYSLSFADPQGAVFSYYMKNAPKETFNEIGEDKFFVYTFNALNNIEKKITSSITCRQLYDKKWQIEKNGKKIHSKMSLLPIRKNFAIEHAYFWNKFMFSIEGAQPNEFEEIILKAITELKSNSTINPLLKLLILRNMFQQLQLVTNGVSAISYKETTDDIIRYFEKTFPENTDWIQLTSLQRDGINAYINRIPDYFTRERFRLIRQFVAEQTLARRPTPVGVVNEDNKTVKIFKPNTVGELWTIVKTDTGIAVKIIGSVTEDQLNIELTDGLYYGQPIFSPMDGKNTAKVVDQIKAKAIKLDAKIKWPTCWPINRR